jgi:uncharacterized protein (TIGR03067 family)
MRRFFLLTVGLLLAAAAPAVAQTQEIQERLDNMLRAARQLQGTWTAETAVVNGKKVAAEKLKGRALVVTGMEFQYRAGDRVEQGGEFSVDPGQTPSHLDLAVTEGKPAGKVLGVYELKGDRLTVSYDTAGKGRPADLKPGESRSVIVYRRKQ